MGFAKKSVLALAIVIALASVSVANASLLIEPHVGYIFGGKSSYNGADITWDGPDYGARLGGQWLGFQAGFDYSHSTFDTKATVGAVSVTSSHKRDLMGAFVGYKFPVLFRVWATYIFSGKTTTTSGSSSGNWTKGTGMEIGAGYTGLPFINLNLSYRSASDDKNQSGTLNPKFDTKEFLFSISAPFTLL